MLLFLLRVMGLAKTKATVGTIKASKHSPWLRYVFLRTESVTVPCSEISLKLAAVPQRGRVAKPGSDFLEHCMLHAQQRTTEKQLNKLRSPRAKKTEKAIQ